MVKSLYSVYGEYISVLCIRHKRQPINSFKAKFYCEALINHTDLLEEQLFNCRLGFSGQLSANMSEKMCLQWNDFKDNINSAFGSLREDTDLTDVTLACEDGQQLEAHKVVLAASSPFFQDLLKRNKHPHPLVYMRGVKFENLLAIVDFLYLGETNIQQELLDSFLAIAEELQLKGLMGQNNSEEGEAVEKMTAASEANYPKQVFKRESQVSKAQDLVNFSEHTDKTVSLTANFSRDLQDLDEQVKSLMERNKNYETEGWKKGYICKVCGKEGQSIHIKNHIEAHHLEGISIPCNYCEKTTSSRKELTAHKHQHHKSNPM